MHHSLQASSNFSLAARWRSRRIYLVGIVGTIFEWYDFALYGCFADIFANQFFNHLNHVSALILTYMIFFISYLARPIGGLLYGLIGDNFGRRPAMLISISMITLCMFITACLPTWKTVGALAPFCLILFRIIQGLSVGGEAVGSLIYVLESVATRRQGIFGGAIWAMGWIGLFSATATAVLLMHRLNQTQLYTWGWRLAYLLGGMIGLIIFSCRMFIPESIEFEQARLQTKRHDEKQAEPVALKKILLQHWSVIFRIISLLAMLTVIGVFTTFYFPQYLHQYFAMPLVTGWTINIAHPLILTVGMILFGSLADRIGTKKLLVFAASCFLLFSYPLLSLLALGQWYVAMLVLFSFSSILAIYDGPLPAALVRLTPLPMRYTVFGLGYNLTIALFGGSAPLICSLLARLSPLAPAFYFMLLAALALGVLYFIEQREI